MNVKSFILVDEAVNAQCPDPVNGDDGLLEGTADTQFTGLLGDEGPLQQQRPLVRVLSNDFNPLATGSPKRKDKVSSLKGRVYFVSLGLQRLQRVFT